MSGFNAFHEGIRSFNVNLMFFQYLGGGSCRSVAMTLSGAVHSPKSSLPTRVLGQRIHHSAGPVQVFSIGEIIQFCVSS